MDIDSVQYHKKLHMTPLAHDC